MADKTFMLEIVTPERVVLKQNVVSVVAPGSEGEFGVLADHAPLMAELVIGVITLRDHDTDMYRLATSGGFVEVRENTVRILADTAERASEIDVARAQEAKRRAEERLHDSQAEIDHVRAEAALKRAIVRLRVASED